MLFYLSLRSSFDWMPASPLSSPDMRRQRSRIASIPASARSAEDWLTLAEVSLSYDGKQAAARRRGTGAQVSPVAVAEGAARPSRCARRRAPSTATKRRRSFSGGQRRGSTPGVARSRSTAAILRARLPIRTAWRRPPAISGGGPYAALAEAWTAGFLKDIPAAIDVVKRAEARYPDDPSLPAYRAQLALLIDDREQVKAAIDRSLAIDPDDPTALEARANYKAGIESDLEGALADLTRAAAIAPG